jgi:hypothetical protein
MAILPCPLLIWGVRRTQSLEAKMEFICAQ